jgi:hypothetical protein
MSGLCPDIIEVLRGRTTLSSSNASDGVEQRLANGDHVQALLDSRRPDALRLEADIALFLEEPRCRL